jgi:hypothetical protein
MYGLRSAQVKAGAPIRGQLGPLHAEIESGLRGATIYR